ncbi:MAG: hypothetical protein JNM56_18855 [Planctomycetia bacterium]|nr:hypothetical protein [Planctomycetia bacterium]
MSTRWMPVIVLTVGLIGAATSRAGAPLSCCGPGPAPHCCCQPAPPCLAPVTTCCDPRCCDKVVDSTSITLYERQEATVLPELNIREVVTRAPTTKFDVDYKEEKRCVIIMVPKARDVQRLVKSIHWIPETSVDPCTGCCCTTYKPVENCKVETIQIFEPVPEQREVTVRVPVLKAVPSEVAVTHLTADWSSKPAIVTKLDMKMVPTKVCVPGTCPPPPPPPVFMPHFPCIP